MTVWVPTTTTVLLKLTPLLKVMLLVPMSYTPTMALLELERCPADTLGDSTMLAPPPEPKPSSTVTWLPTALTVRFISTLPPLATYCALRTFKLAVLP